MRRRGKTASRRKPPSGIRDTRFDSEEEDDSEDEDELADPLEGAEMDIDWGEDQEEAAVTSSRRGRRKRLTSGTDYSE